MRRTTGAVAALVVAAALTGCTPDGQTPPATTTTAIAGPSQVTLAVYGPDPVISAYTAIAARSRPTTPRSRSTSVPTPTTRPPWPLSARTSAPSRAPDIFLSGEDDLEWLRAAKATQDVDKMLSDRNIDFGDGYERVGLEAFSADSALQCMPVDVSPLVVYYNARLVHLAKIRPPGQKPPNSDDGWRMADFATAARQAFDRRQPWCLRRSRPPPDRAVRALRGRTGRRRHRQPHPARPLQWGEPGRHAPAPAGGAQPGTHVHVQAARQA
jgi:multiple sugar transport system substrate-binding protein